MAGVQLGEEFNGRGHDGGRIVETGLPLYSVVGDGDTTVHVATDAALARAQHDEELDLSEAYVRGSGDHVALHVKGLGWIARQ